MSTILALRKNEHTNIVTAPDVLRKDVAYWCVIAIALSLVQLGIFALVASTSPNVTVTQAGAFIWPQLNYALIFLACIAARKTIDVWTFVLGFTLIAGWLSVNSESITRVLLPNSILASLVGMIGLLAIGRLAMYVRAKYALNIVSVTFSRGAIATYACVIVASFLLNSGTAYRFCVSLFS